MNVGFSTQNSTPKSQLSFGIKAKMTPEFKELFNAKEARKVASYLNGLAGNNVAYKIKDRYFGIPSKYIPNAVKEKFAEKIEPTVSFQKFKYNTGTIAAYFSHKGLPGHGSKQIEIGCTRPTLENIKTLVEGANENKDKGIVSAIKLALAEKILSKF